MKNLQDQIIDSLKKQNQSIQYALGLSSLSAIADSIGKFENKNRDYLGLGSISDIARNIALKTEKHFPLSTISSSIANQMAALQLPTNNFAILGLSSSIAQISVQNKLLSEKIANLATSHIAATGSLAQIAIAMRESHLSQFNTLNVALQGISSGFLKEIVAAKAWEDFDIAEEANIAISNIAEETISSSVVLTKSDLENFRTLLIEELSDLLFKSKTEKVRQFLIELMTVIGFILTCYSTQQMLSDKSNNDVIIETKKELNKLSNEFSERISKELQKLNKMRVATTNANLKFSAKKNSKIIGLVKRNQAVTVIEIRHKYLLISYIDFETGEPKSGFVEKKHFKIKK